MSRAWKSIKSFSIKRIVCFGILGLVVGGIGSLITINLLQDNVSILRILEILALLATAIFASRAAAQSREANIISKKSLEISIKGPPINIDVKIRKKDHNNPFVIMVTNMWHKDIRPLQIILEVRDLNGDEIKNMGPTKDTDFRIRFKSKHMASQDSGNNRFDVIKPIDRESYPIIGPPIFDAVDENPNKLQQLALSRLQMIEETLSRAIEQTGEQEFTLFGGVEIPYKDKEYIRSEEYLRINFNSEYKGFKMLGVKHIAGDVEGENKTDLHYGFYLNDTLEIKSLGFGSHVDPFKLRDEILATESNFLDPSQTTQI